MDGRSRSAGSPGEWPGSCLSVAVAAEPPKWMNPSRMGRRWVWCGCGAIAGADAGSVSGFVSDSVAVGDADAPVSGDGNCSCWSGGDDDGYGGGL